MHCRRRELRARAATPGVVTIGLLLMCTVRCWCLPAISNVRTSLPSVGQYEVIEVDFDVATVATHLSWPYDPTPPVTIPPGTGITVDALFSNDDWQTTQTVPAFYYQDYERLIATGDGMNYHDEAVVPVGKPHWRARFAPTTPGTWHYRLRVQDSSGVATYPADGDMSFECTPSSNRGYVRPCAADPRYFELSDGTPLLPAGVNVQFTSTYQAESLLRTLGQNHVQVVRWMLTYRGWQNPFGGGSVATLGGPQWDFTLRLSSSGGAQPGDRFAAEVAAGRETRQRFYGVAGRTYRLSGYIKAVAVGGDTGKGLVAFAGSAVSSPITGDHDWMPFSITFRPTYTGSYLAGIRHTGTAGIGYFDDLSLKYTTDGGATWSGEMLAKADMDFQNYVDPLESWKTDRVFQAAQANGVYLKTVITEKQDQTLGSIDANGNTVARSDTNFYSGPDQPSRWLQKAWWRYMCARWGAYTSLHSWELCNEGDPFRLAHYEAANALADYVHSIHPRRIMCTTSFWHSLPMEFWKTSSVDYLDVHEYFGPSVPTTGSHGPRFYAWSDANTSASNESVLLPLDWPCATLDYDTTVKHSGSRSIRISTKLDSGSIGFANLCPAYHVGIDPTHTYTIRCKMKGDNIQNQGGGFSWQRPYIEINWSKAYVENDYVTRTRVPGELGTYDWTTVSATGIRPPSEANTANILILVPVTTTSTSTLWFDDIEFIDETTGRNLYVDGSFEGDRIDYDTGLAVRKYGVLLGSYAARVRKPVVWGETGIRGPNSYGTPYKGYQYDDECQDLVDDGEGVHIKKMIWAHAGPDNPNMLYWWTQNISKKGLWYYFRAFGNFMQGIRLTDGHYQDAAAVTSHPGLRAIGQKDLSENCAHLWIDNIAYTWKNSVGGAAVAPVSGTVTISGLQDGRYKVEWWDTSSGTITRTEDMLCTGGNVVLDVTNLQSDTACKVYPSPANIGLRILVPTTEVVPGQTITVTVEYTNLGANDAKNSTVTATVPEELDYVAGSAEASGGVWDAANRSVSWIVDSLAPGAKGTRTFQARVR